MNIKILLVASVRISFNFSRAERDAIASKNKCGVKIAGNAVYNKCWLVDIFTDHHNHISELELFIINLATEALTKICKKKISVN